MPTAAAPPPTAFDLEHVVHHRAGRRVLDDVVLSIPAGRITGLLGPSGAGKSSLLRLLNRLDDPESGTVRFHGRRLAEYPVRALRREVAFVFQTPVMFPGTVAANLETAAALAGLGGAEADQRARSAARSAGLSDDLTGRNGAELSVGQQQRVNLARALLAGPRALVLDEPTAALDPETAEHLLGTFRTLCTESGITIVMATHRLDEARRVADHVVMMREGRVVESGDAPAIWSAPRDESTKRFLARREEDTPA